jgi:hypothetical protein
VGGRQHAGDAGRGIVIGGITLLMPNSATVIGHDAPTVCHG